MKELIDKLSKYVDSLENQLVSAEKALQEKDAKLQEEIRLQEFYKHQVAILLNKIEYQQKLKADVARLERDNIALTKKLHAIKEYLQ